MGSNKKKKILIIGKNSFFTKNFCTKLKNNKLIKLGRKDKLSSISFKNLDLIINCAADVYDEKKMFNNNTLLVYKILKKHINEKNNEPQQMIIYTLKVENNLQFDYQPLL